MSCILLFIVPIYYSASGCNVSTCVHPCAIIMSHVLMRMCSDAVSRVSIRTFCEKGKAVENFKVKK